MKFNMNTAHYVYRGQKVGEIQNPEYEAFVGMVIHMAIAITSGPQSFIQKFEGTCTAIRENSQSFPNIPKGDKLIIVD
jgi:hypothetical protein